MEKTELTTTRQANNALAVMASYDEYGEIKAEEVRIPRVELLQPMSPEVQEEGSTLKPGDIIESIGKTKLPEVFIPIKKLKTTYCLFNGTSARDDFFDPSREPRSLIISTINKEDEAIKPYLTWGKDSNGKTVAPIAKEVISFLVLFHGETMPRVLSFSKSNHKQGIAFFNMLLQFKGREKMCQRKYSLKSKKVQKDGNTWFEYNITPAGQIISLEGEYLDEFAAEVVNCFIQYKDYDPSDTTE